MLQTEILTLRLWLYSWDHDSLFTGRLDRSDVKVIQVLDPELFKFDVNLIEKRSI